MNQQKWGVKSEPAIYFVYILSYLYGPCVTSLRFFKDIHQESRLCQIFNIDTRAQERTKPEWPSLLVVEKGGGVGVKFLCGDSPHLPMNL